MGNQNFCVFRSEKLKSHKDVTNVLKEQQRSEDYDSKRADKNLSVNNTYSWDYEFSQKLYDDYLPKKYRKDAVVGLMFVVTTSNEFENPEDEEQYYRKAVAFIRQRFGKVVGWAIHRDETSTHLQAVTIPLVDGKLNAKKLIGGSKHRMQEIQQEFYEQVGKPFGLERGKENSQAQHKTVEEKHKEELRKLWESAHKIEELQKNLEARECEILDRENNVAEKEKELLQKETDLNNKETVLNEREEIMAEKIQKKAEKIAPAVAVENAPKTLSEALQTFEKAVDMKEHQLDEKARQNENMLAEWQKLAKPESIALLHEADEMSGRNPKPVNLQAFAGRVRKALTGAWETVKHWMNKAKEYEKELAEKRSALDAWRRRSPAELEDMARKLKLEKCRNSYELIEKEKARAGRQKEINNELGYGGRS